MIAFSFSLGYNKYIIKGLDSMNNNMPNNNSNNGENDLNAVSLGSVGFGNTNDIPPVPPVESLDSTVPNSVGVQPSVNPEPINPNSTVTSEVTPNVNPVPPVDNATQTVNSVPPVEPVAPGTIPSLDEMSQGTIPPVDPIPSVTPINYDVPEAINNFNATPIFNEIGTVPPISDIPVPTPTMKTDELKPKKKVNKLIFVIIIVLLIAAVGVGVYIFLNMSNKNAASVVTKEVQIEAGSQVSTNIDDYATFNGVDSSTCGLDTSKITDTNTLGNEYPFTITCNSVTYDGTATVVDTIAPSAVSKDVTVQVNGSVSPDDFISGCNDATGCSYAFSDSNAVSEHIGSAGEYSVEITVTDEVGNISTVSATLTVTEEEVPDLYLSCTLNNETLKLGVTASSFTGSAVRTYTFTFDNADEYNSFKAQNSSSEAVTYQNVTGAPSFDDSTLTLTLTQNLTKAELDQEEGSTLPNSYGELRQYYSGQGYTCVIEQP